jgi:hypothetical protein
MRWMYPAALVAAAACSGGGGDNLQPQGDATAAPSDALTGISTVFLIVMENHNWSAPSPGHVILGSASAPYINDTLLPMAAHAEDYHAPDGLHPSEPNYIWLEAGDDQGLTHDYDPSPTNSIPPGDHLVNLLEDAGIAWMSYQEDMPEGVCPIKSEGLYVARHNPFVYFQDITQNSERSRRCRAHVRPFTELQPALDADEVSGYVFITPNLCHDMHGSTRCPAGQDKVLEGDRWLATWVPAILASPVYQAGGAAVLITWDEGTTGDYPIGMIVVAPDVTGGYSNDVAYTHSSTVRTLQEIFGLAPMLGDAVNATSLADLFVAHR